MITREAHEELLRASSLGRYILRAASSAGEAGARQWAISLRSSHERAPLGDTLKSTVCEALIELRARSVRVTSEYGGQGGLHSIPEILDAVRSAWLSPEGLQRQIRASAAGKEMPTWPVLVQREIRPERVKWTASDAGGSNAQEPGEDANPGSGGAPASLRELSLRARAVLGEPARIEWGLANGEWYILDIRPTGDKDSSPVRHSARREAPAALARGYGDAEQTVVGRLEAYVETLGLQECVGILAASPISLASLVETDQRSQVHRGEERTFEAVIRAWALRTLYMEADDA